MNNNNNNNNTQFSSLSNSSSSSTLPLPSNEAKDNNTDTTWTNCICRTRHPIAAFFHICFKSIALFLYIFHSWLSSTYVTSFVMIVLLLAIDFWTVKNITGRLLVGLRWWNRLAEDGLTNEWIFESSTNYSAIPTLDRRLFWGTLYLTPVIFSFFFLTSFLSFSWDWSLISGIGVGLTGANLFGYIKCSKDAQNRLSSTFQGMSNNTLQFLTRAILPTTVSSASSILSNTNTNNSNTTNNSTTIPNSVLSVAVNSALTSFLNVTGAANTNSSSSTNINNDINTNLNHNISSRQLASRSGPGSGMVTSNISDFDAVSDPFGDRMLASSREPVVI